MNDIQLYNRDGAFLLLNYCPENGNHYLLCDNEHNFVMEHMRYGIDPDDETNITFIDPAGGPFLEVGRNFNAQGKTYQVEKIVSIAPVTLHLKEI